MMFYVIIGIMAVLLIVLFILFLLKKPRSEDLYDEE